MMYIELYREAQNGNPGSNMDQQVIAIVLSGGGAKGSFEVGALLALQEIWNEVRPCIVCGSSVGAINALAVAENSDGSRLSIIIWSARSGALRQQGRQVDEGLLKHVVPVHSNHINLTGDYSWRKNKRVEKGGFRPLRISAEP
jgi:predicted acylesterase/phospholipase RssA